MKAFVTGATGFIGAHLCRKLVADGHSVVALVRNPKKASDLPREVERVEGDLSLFEDPKCVLPACDVFIHMAAVIAARKADDYNAINFTAVKNVVQCLERQTWRPRRFVFASSLAAAGPSARGHRLTEADPATPIDDYGRAKLAAEKLLAGAPFPTTSFRPAVVFGPRDTATLTFFKMASKGFGFRMSGPPQELSFIDVDDLVSGIVAMAGDTSTAHHTYFVSALEDTDSAALWEALSVAVGRRVRVVAVPKSVLHGASIVNTALSSVFGYLNQLDRKQYEQITAPAFLCSSEALQRAYGWVPRVTLAAALEKALAGYKEAGWL
jgi:nucleoside-diphosphate-sugar epimerase